MLNFPHNISLSLILEILIWFIREDAVLYFVVSSFPQDPFPKFLAETLPPLNGGKLILSIQGLYFLKALILLQHGSPI